MRTRAADEESKRVLVVEDDGALAMAITDRLESEGFVVEGASDGNEGLARARRESYDLILLDVMLPGKSGFDVASELRAQGVETPILMLTARGEVTDKVVGLQLGADDYLTKPFEFIELLARIRALLRRPTMGAPEGAADPFEFDGVVVSFRKAEVTKDGVPVSLSALEFHLLRHFIEHRGVLLSRNELLDAVWGYDVMISTRTVDVHVARLRQKVERDPQNPRFILTVRGMGYKLDA